MGTICEHEFEKEDPRNKGYSLTEYDLHARLNMTIRKNLKDNRYEIINLNRRQVAYSFSRIEDVVRMANELEGGENTEVKCGIGCPNRKMKPEDRYQLNWETTEAMIQFGGKFVKNLGKLWRLGDLENQRKIENTFREYWRRYQGFAIDEGKKDKRWYDK